MSGNCTEFVSLDEAMALSGVGRLWPISGLGSPEWTWNVLITGSYDQRTAFVLQTFADCLDTRRHTTRCRLWCEEANRRDKLREAVDAAKTADVTLQLLCSWSSPDDPSTTHELGGGASVRVSEPAESYPVLVLGSHGMQWRARKE